MSAEMRNCSPLLPHRGMLPSAIDGHALSPPVAAEGDRGQLFIQPSWRMISQPFPCAGLHKPCTIQVLFLEARRSLSDVATLAAESTSSSSSIP